MSIKLNVEDEDFSLHIVLIFEKQQQKKKTVWCHFATSQRVAVDMHGVSILLYIVFAIVSIL